MSGSSCLLPEPGITLLPSLAGKIGVNEALFLQQIHYWITRRAGAIDQYGRYWIYNTIKQWQEQLSFLSESTLKRAIGNLESDGVLLTTWIGSGFSRKKAYTIDYDRVDRISQEIVHDLVQKSMKKGREQKNPMIVVSAPPPQNFDAQEDVQITEDLPVELDDAPERFNLTYRDRQNGAIEQFNLTRRTVQNDLSERVNLTSREVAKEAAEIPVPARVHSDSLARACVTNITAQNTQKTTIGTEDHVEEEIRDGTSTAEVCPDEICQATRGISSEPVLSDNEELLCFCDALGVPRTSAEKFIRKYGAERVQEKLKLLKDSQKRQRIINAGGWLYKALQQDYHLSPLQKKKIAQAENLRVLAEKTRTQIDLEVQTEIQESASVSPEILRKFPVTIQEKYRKSRESSEGRASLHSGG